MTGECFIALPFPIKDGDTIRFFIAIITTLIILLTPNYANQTEYRPLAPIKVIEPSRGVVRERSITVEATAYCLTTPTFTGHKTHIGSIAVDPKVIPLYSRCWVEGYGYATALDTGKDIKGNRIDVWLPSRSQCMNWGRRTVEVKILE